MATTQTDIKSQTLELSTEAFEAFCGDISGMFGIDMACRQEEIAQESIKSLKKRFKELNVVVGVKAKGALNGTFLLILDKEGLFTFGGMMAMLPENRILENLKQGTLKDAQDISDTIKKGCNLLIGSWDRVFRKEMAGHGHFVQGDTFIGNPWDEPEKKIGLAGDKEFVFVPYEMTIAKYPAFKCGVLFPKTVFGPAAVSNAGQNTAPDKTAVKEDTKTAVESKPDADSKESSNSIPAEKPAVTVETKEIKEQPISETIQKMTQSPAVLPGEQPSLSSEIYAKDIMQKDVIWGSPDDSVQQTLAKMRPGEPAFVLIGQDNIPQGIVSKSDATGAISPYLRPVFAKWRRPQDDATLQIKVKWIMSKPVRTINTDASLETMMEKLCELGGGCLAVADQQGKVVGLVTQVEIFRALLKKQP